MSFLLFIFVFALIIVFSFISFGLSIIRSILGLFLPSLFGQRNRSTSQQQSADSGNSHQSDSTNRKKIFDKGEGDYAEFEELKG
jgi:hypothetical protein